MYISKWQPHARAFDPTQIKQAGESPPNRVSLDLGRATQPVLGACLHKYEHGVAGAVAKLIYLKQMARTCVVQQPPGNRKRQKETENNGIYI